MTGAHPSRPDRGRIVLLVPLAPQRSGNGLAMRAGATLEALAAAAPVDLVIVPVSGPATPTDWARAHARSIVTAELSQPDDAHAHVTALLADARLRHQLVRTAPVPARASLAPPTLAGALAQQLGDAPTAAVVVMRTYLAPLGVELARVLGTSGPVRVVVDADDDDEALLRTLGDDAEADALHRLAAAWLPDADEVWAAAPAEADALRARHQLAKVRTVPNTVRLPAPVAPPPGEDRLLFVGNLTYAPNLDAARTLALDVLPRVREQRPYATLDLVGTHAPRAVDDLAAIEGVHVHGAVPEVAPWYARADVVVVPLHQGAGTRIKLLEAAAYRRPIVASSAALGGLELLPDEEVILADGPIATADAVATLLDPVTGQARAVALTDAAHDAVARRYVCATVGPVIRRGALGEPEPAATLSFRVLWHDVTVEAADDNVVTALAAMAPTATHDFDATHRTHYGVEGSPGAYRILEDGDLVTTVATADEARDELHRRLHRRIFELASRQGWVRLHGALVDLGGSRVLLTGPSGAGKSTLATRLLLDGHAGVSVQGDESVMVRGDECVAVARPFHLKPGAEHLLPKIEVMRKARAEALPRIDDVVVIDPGRLGHDWHLSVARLDHLVLLGSSPDDGVRLTDEPHTAVLPELVPQLFPVTETKSALLRALTRSLGGVRCHRLTVGALEAMSRTLMTRFG